jgi:hypothetical protein
VRFDHFCYLAPHRPTLTNDAAQPTNGGATADQEALRGWWTGLIGSPFATLFITVLFLSQLTENLQYQRVIKDQAVPGETEAVLMSISHNQASSRNLL